MPTKKTPTKKVVAKRVSISSKKIEVEKPAKVSTPVPRAAPTSHNMFDVKWSKYIPEYVIPNNKQLAVLMLPNVKEILFGGALGGGKSELLLMESVRYCDIPGFSSIIFRRQLTDLKQPGALISRSHKWLGRWAEAGNCRYIADEHAWSFKCYYPGTDIPGPEARMQFGYIGEAAIRERYQSAEYSLCAFDELAQWQDDVDYLFMRTRIRITVCPVHGRIPGTEEPKWNDNCHLCACLRQMPLRMRSATNPGPAWIKRRFGIVPDPFKYKTKRTALIAMQEGEKVNFVGSHSTRLFIPSFLEDNKALSAKDYREMLRELSPEERSRLEDGNWEARQDARFKRRWQRYYQLSVDGFALLDGLDRASDLLPFSALRNIFVVVDPAVTVREGPVDEQMRIKKSYCAIGVFGTTITNQLIILEMLKFRKEIPDIIETMVALDKKWSPKFHKVEVNGVGIGVAQYASLAGLFVRKNIRKTDKIENSISAMMLMKNGQILFPETAQWLDEYDVEDTIFGWTGLPTEEDDLVDVLCDAAHELTPQVAAPIANPDFRRSIPKYVKEGFLPKDRTSNLSPQLKQFTQLYFN